MAVGPVAAVVVPICPAWCGAGWLLCVPSLAVALWCGLFAGADGAVLCGFALCAGGAGVAGVAVLCGLSAVLVVLAVDFAGMAFGSCMGLGGTIGGSEIDLV